MTQPGFFLGGYSESRAICPSYIEDRQEMTKIRPEWQHLRWQHESNSESFCKGSQQTRQSIWERQSRKPPVFRLNRAASASDGKLWGEQGWQGSRVSSYWRGSPEHTADLHGHAELASGLLGAWRAWGSQPSAVYGKDPSAPSLKTYPLPTTKAESTCYLSTITERNYGAKRPGKPKRVTGKQLQTMREQQLGIHKTLFKNPTAFLYRNRSSEMWKGNSTFIASTRRRNLGLYVTNVQHMEKTSEY